MNSVVLYTIAGVAQIIAIVAGIVAFKLQQRESDDAKREIITHQDQSTDRVLAALHEQNKSLKDKLWEKYPFGYVLFGGDGGDVVALPFYRGDLQVEADWSKAQIRIDQHAKTVQLKIPQPTWKQDSGPIIHIHASDGAYWAGHYSLGQPVPISLVSVQGQPNMYFEVLNEDQRTPVYVIGFRKDN